VRELESEQVRGIKSPFISPFIKGGIRGILEVRW